MKVISEFKGLNLTYYETRVIRALQLKNDLRAYEISRESKVPQGKIDKVLKMLIEKKLIERRVLHTQKKLRPKKIRELTLAIEKSVEFGLKIKILGFNKIYKMYHLNGNLKNYCDNYIKKQLLMMNSLKNKLVGLNG